MPCDVAWCCVVSCRAAVTPVAAGLNVRQRIERFYRHYNPEKLEDPGFLDTVLSTYKGHERILLRQLVALYGPEPTE